MISRKEFCRNMMTRRTRRSFYFSILFIQLFLFMFYFGIGKKKNLDKPDIFPTPKTNSNPIQITESTSIGPVKNKILTFLPPTKCGYLIRPPFDGRLGNHMLMYASFYGILKKFKNANKTGFLGISPNKTMLNDVFPNLTYSGADIPRGWLNENGVEWINETKCCTYEEIGFENLKCDGKSFVFSGFRQSYKYFENSMDEIKKEFTFNTNIQNQCRNRFRDILSKNNLRHRCVNIGVHLRRGDFTSKGEMEIGHFPAQFDYFQRAVRFYEDYYYYKKNNANCLIFLIFGDDYEWNLNATNRIELMKPENSHLILTDPENIPAAVDLCVMSICDNLAISTGTFGWWAGFLNKGRVVYQKEYGIAGTKYFNEFSKDDSFLPHWIGL